MPLTPGPLVRYCPTTSSGQSSFGPTPALQLAEDISMKDSTKDKVEGAVHDAKGTIKERVGHATNNPNLEAEGQDEKVAGKIQKKVGDVEKVFEK
jgi:uncharacterized protein YjbJ (UPF0337 family)